MRSQILMSHVLKIGVMLSSLLFISFSVSANDWHELTEMDHKNLIEKIDELQKELDQDTSDYETLKGLGIAFHTMARNDAKAYASKAVKFLSRASEADKGDYEVMCYEGSALTMMAKTAWNPIKKMYYVNKGTSLMDKAVRSAPNNITVRITRAVNSKSLPSFLGRGDIAFEDFEYLKALVERNPDSLKSIKKKVYSNLAELYGKAGDKSKADHYRRLAESITI
ncbi:MAG TPA: hypothetical protein PLQ82_12745 [Desulfobacteraceae bacterium]|nr:hypothetical protein [Desulfobacteraceae bacterium]HPQ29335.1 hypothetical protein [Desulfobacteraceae bacterium]